MDDLPLDLYNSQFARRCGKRILELPWGTFSFRSSGPPFCFAEKNILSFTKQKIKIDEVRNNLNKQTIMPESVGHSTHSMGDEVRCIRLCDEITEVQLPGDALVKVVGD